MAWIERRSQKWIKREKPARAEKTYSVSEVAGLLSVSRNTVFKWLDPENAVIPPHAWFKLPKSGHIRIKEWIVLDLMN